MSLLRHMSLFNLMQQAIYLIAYIFASLRCNEFYFYTVYTKNEIFDANFIINLQVNQILKFIIKFASN